MTAETILGGSGKHYTLDSSVAQVRSITIPTGQMSGQVTVTTAGTAVQGPDISGTNGFYVKAMAANTGALFVGNNGSNDVASTNGFEMAASAVIILQVENLSQVWFDAATSGNKASWLKA